MHAKSCILVYLPTFTLYNPFCQRQMIHSKPLNMFPTHSLHMLPDWNFRHLGITLIDFLPPESYCSLVLCRASLLGWADVAMRCGDLRRLWVSSSSCSVFRSELSLRPQPNLSTLYRLWLSERRSWSNLLKTVSFNPISHCSISILNHELNRVKKFFHPFPW